MGRTLDVVMAAMLVVPSHGARAVVPSHGRCGAGGLRCTGAITF